MEALFNVTWGQSSLHEWFRKEIQVFATLRVQLRDKETDKPWLYFSVSWLIGVDQGCHAREKISTSVCLCTITLILGSSMCPYNQGNLTLGQSFKRKWVETRILFLTFLASSLKESWDISKKVIQHRKMKNKSLGKSHELQKQCVSI